ncbi:hypothetical protein EMIHUDRAFT_449205 [Emiliania huxleyi CCMP1516]|uniref:Protein kinase domain-containing protein n=2 Tax=Emiliania huxleyi TaxID=2903 RepID=A0A0D3KI23_EMIH1|nr:hypothetical protein EMIHUDRAFT_449205 [Emiliania huxleyi CCMP1516]EOD35408.1 hypothetical protein EMIHUDRAFT_449205 [Emiliania huxleyi CCMP1516]|eukprot:XP_005787837.1 hypothetical protein EMIHUDRAFT_449205 [Emiliania huxleyi CCMP1516]
MWAVQAFSWLSPSAPARCDGAPPAPTAASELEGKVTHLMELLKAHQSRDAEASRLQQALQCQEEADAAKLVELMRRQEAASAAAVEEAKAAIEAQLVERFREEQAAAAEAHSAQLQQLSAEHSTQLQQAAALLEAQAREKFETAVAHERAYLSALKQLELDVDAGPSDDGAASFDVRDLSPAAEWRQLSDGGYSEVYKARLLGVTVAVKQATSRKKTSGEALMREVRYLRLAGAHPNIVTAFGAFAEGGRLHLVLEYARHCLRNDRVARQIDPILTLAGVLRALDPSDWVGRTVGTKKRRPLPPNAGWARRRWLDPLRL